MIEPLKRAKNFLKFDKQCLIPNDCLGHFWNLIDLLENNSVVLQIETL